MRDIVYALRHTDSSFPSSLEGTQRWAAARRMLEHLALETKLGTGQQDY